MAKPGTSSNIISHWHHPIQNFKTSSLDFYSAVEQALRPHQIPDLSVSRVDWNEGGILSSRREYLRVRRGKFAFDICGAPFGDDFFFSWWFAEIPPRLGLLVLAAIAFGSLIFVGAATQMFGFFGGLLFACFALPFTIGFLGYAIRNGHLGHAAEEVLLATPVFGMIYARIFKPDTYYKMDTALVFQSAVHSAVLSVVDQVTSAKGIRALTELERKPIMHEFFRK